MTRELIWRQRAYAGSFIGVEKETAMKSNG
jgi:hypothetical protein